ncbi:MAG TPA: hypothetical protein VF100_11015 [Thermoanaerobaculia bacterium]
MHRPLSVRPPLVVTFAALAVLAAASPAAAEVRDLTIEIQAEAPTWQDPITLTVRGEASCFVELFDVSEHFVFGTGVTVRVELEEICLIDPPSFIPFEVTTEALALAPGEYTVQVTRAGEPGTVLADAPLTVFDVADVQIHLPAQPPTDAAPFTIRVSGLTHACGGLEPAEVIGDVILLRFPDGCPILPPGSGLQTFDYLVGPLPAGDYEVRVLRQRFGPPPALAKAELHVFDDAGCLPESDVLCLNRDRFAVRVQWRDFQGNTGVGQALPLLDDTGLFWFFHPENVELTVKVLDACDPFGHFWVFIASGSTVEYEIRVTDTHSDPEETAIYRNGLGEVPSLIPDTGAFVCP